MTKLLLAACLLTSALAAPSFAANANRPYQNCDRKVDNCGPTGDDRTDQLNAQQLGGSPTMPAPGPMTGAPPMPMQPSR